MEPVLRLNEYAKYIGEGVAARGFSQPKSLEEREHITVKLFLIGTELAEAGEDIRKKNDAHFPEELADVAIRLFDLASSLGIDLEQAIRTKEAYNRTRPMKHGKEF